MTAPMSVEEREHLARLYAVELAPRLRNAIDRQDADYITDMLSGLDYQQLLALVVALASRWPSKKCGQFVTCRVCGEEDRHAGRGLCGRCYRRAGGKPVPSAPVPPQESGRRGALHLIEAKTNRLEDFAHLADWDVSDEEAAERLNVSPRTIGRYRAALRDGLQLRFPANEERRAS